MTSAIWNRRKKASLKRSTSLKKQFYHLARTMCVIRLWGDWFLRALPQNISNACEKMMKLLRMTVTPLLWWVNFQESFLHQVPPVSHLVILSGWSREKLLSVSSWKCTLSASQEAWTWWLPSPGGPAPHCEGLWCAIEKDSVHASWVQQYGYI